MTDMNKELFFCVQDAIEQFKIKFPDFFTLKGYTEIAANTLCMLTACYIEKALEGSKLSEKLTMATDILELNKKYLKFHDQYDKAHKK